MPEGVGYGPGTTADSDNLNPDKQPLPVNQPLSPYGEQADLQRLSQAMAPAAGPPGAAGAPGPEAPPIGRPGAPSQYSPSDQTIRRAGVPEALLAPTQRPEVGVGSQPPARPRYDDEFAPPTQDTMAILSQLAQSPQVSPQTRAWAASLVRILGEGRSE